MYSTWGIFVNTQYSASYVSVEEDGIYSKNCKVITLLISEEENQSMSTFIQDSIKKNICLK